MDLILWENLALRRMPGMLQEMCHFKSRVASKMRPRQKFQFPSVLQNFWEIMADRSIRLRNSPVFVANRGSKLTKSWGKSGPQEEAGNVTQNGPFYFARSVQNPAASEISTFQDLAKFRGNPDRPICLQNGLL